MKIPESVRRDVLDGLRIEKTIWSGRLEEPEFLSRIFDLEKLPSTDGRFNDAYGDIWQHRVNNPHDWEDDWVYEDHRFDLLTGDDQVFLRFLCEMLHPVVRPDGEETERLLQMFNDSLRSVGYEIAECARIARRPVFAARHLSSYETSAIESVRKAFSKMDASHVSQQITRMESAVENDPGLAIGTAKELVETCCRTILHERSVDVDKAADLSQLVKLTSRELQLTPDDIPQERKAAEIIRRLLSNLASIVRGIAELRNEYGTGHGKGAGTKGLSPRHAKLAVGAASTLVVFLLETDELRRESAGNQKKY